MEDELRKWAASRGYEVAWAPVSVLAAVEAELQERLERREIDDTFARANLSFDRVTGDGSSADRRLVVVVVVPRPAHRVGFVVDGRRIDAILPPTYQRYRATFDDVRSDLATNALPGVRVERVNIPLKSLAARLGLVRYGLNNLVYSESTGSYLQLLGYLTDADLPVDPEWNPLEPRLLDECDGCGLCETVCPTGAIGSDRVLLRAERCLTLANESPADWPDWVPPWAHHTLVGCLYCQRACPANPPLPESPTGVTFDDKETKALIGGGERTGPLWARIDAKLQELGLTEQDVLGRNLSAMLRARSR